MNRAIGACLLIALATARPSAAAEHVSFLACPVAQDLGSDRDLCFFTVHNGIRYGLSNPADWGNPQLGHLVLVEGSVSGGREHCGGVPIEGRVSVMPELAPECDEIVPPTPDLLAESRLAPAGLSDAVRMELQADPGRTLQAVRLPPVPVPQVVIGRTETIYFPFESDRASGPDALLMLELARLAVGAPYARITIRSYQGATLLDDGKVLAERAGIARQRGQKIAGILAGLGVPGGAISLETVTSSGQPDGVDDWQSRRAELLVSGLKTDANVTASSGSLP